MVHETVGDAIVEVARNMSLVNGQGMTPYSDDFIASLLAQAHSLIVKEQTWYDCTLAYERVLNGTTGNITVGVPETELKEARKIFRVYHESSMKPLPLVSGYSNRLISTTLYGYELISPSEDPGANKLLLRFFPNILTGRVRFLAKKTFDFTNRDLIIPIDFWLHVYRASWRYATSDGTNSTQIDAFKNDYNELLRLVKEAENARSVNLDPYLSIPDVWWESDDPYWTAGA